jgi:glutamine synthetase
MLGSSASISSANTVLNTAVAEILRQFADELENASDFEKALHELIKRVITAHKRIIFNGNGYDEKWLAEAEKRGLHNLRTTPDALAKYLDEKNVVLFTSHKVYTEKEMQSRLGIFLESYCSIVNIEARTMIDMATRDILPAVSEYSQTLSNTILSKKAVCKKLDCRYEEETLKTVTTLLNLLHGGVKRLSGGIEAVNNVQGVAKKAVFFKDNILPTMAEIRKAADELETLVSADYWPFPTYGELLFGISE